jgi:hypothetical protein
MSGWRRKVFDAPGQVAANVVDDELRQVVGDKTDIHFDLFVA